MRRIFCFILVCAMVLSFCPTVLAVEHESNGSCGGGVVWSIDDDGNMVISGSGYATDSPWNSVAEYDQWANEIKTVVIEDGVYLTPSFAGCTNLISVSLPESLKELAPHCFEDCTALTSIRLPRDMKMISESAFSGCTGLEEITFPDGATSIESHAFSGCTGLKQVHLPDGLELIGGAAFFHCSGLEELIVPNSVWEVGYSAFYGCSGLGELDLPGVTALGEYAVAKCTALERISIPRVNIIFKGTFSWCESLKTVEFSPNLYVIRDGAFANCTGIETLVFPDSLSEIGDYAFRYCTNLRVITIPGMVDVMSQYMLSGCTALEEVRIEEGVSAIRLGCFRGCTNLKSLYLPVSMNEIGPSAFYESNVESIYYNGTETGWDSLLQSLQENSNWDDLEVFSNAAVYTEQSDDGAQIEQMKKTAEEFAGEQLRWFCRDFNADGQLEGIGIISHTNPSYVYFMNADGQVSRFATLYKNRLRYIYASGHVFLAFYGDYSIVNLVGVNREGNAYVQDLDNNVVDFYPNQNGTWDCRLFDEGAFTPCIYYFNASDEMFYGITDVPVDAYYADPVSWALGKGITQGTSNTTFSPMDACTRAQVVTFLYRAAGSPKTGGNASVFTDVEKGSYYYDAVSWAVTEGITQGTSGTTFSPNDICTRAQIVTFLYRYAHGTVPENPDNAFTDVEKSSYYEAPVAWAVAEGITQGTSATTFSPDNICTRGQVVTFLYRLLK